MQRLFLILGSTVAVLAFGAVVSAREPGPAQTLEPVSAFDHIADKSERAVAIFNEAGKVILSPRCVNCHPAGDRPQQGDDGHPHQPLVVRGVDDFGAVGMRCTTCHGPANFDPGGVPGNPKWHMAPLEMAWVGKSLAQICVQIKDKERNGGMSLQDLIHHMGEDELVGWGWHPGAGRTPAPGTQKEFGELIKAWVDNGAACPAS
jgi:hypothetical protein